MSTLSGSKGYIFTLDVVLASFLMISIYAYVSNNLSSAGIDHWSPIQAARLGNDAVVALQKDGVLYTLNHTAIEAKLAEVVTRPYAMQLQIYVYEYRAGFYKNTRIIEVGELRGRDQAAIKGEYPFVVMETGETATEATAFCIARYWIWFD